MGTYHRGDTIRLWASFWTNQTAQALSSAAGALTVTVQDATGYADTNPVVLGPGTPRQEFATVSGSPAANVITFTAALRYAHPVGEIVGELQTPGTHSIRTRNPAGTEASNSSSVSSTGRVYYDLAIPDVAASEGLWHYKPIGSAGVVATDEQTFTVAASVFD